MNRVMPLFLGAAVVMAMANGRGQEANPEETLSDRVDRLVFQLDASELRLRKQAETKLVELGPDALPFLPVEQEVEGAAVRSALRRVRIALRDRAAQRVLKPARVDLQADAIRLSEALALVTQQTGNPVVDLRAKLAQPAPDPVLSLRFDSTPFWTALDVICQKTDLAYQPFSGSRQVGLMAGSRAAGNRDGLVSYSGPFRISARRWEITQDLAQADRRSYRLNVRVMWEPRLRPFFFALPMDRVSGKDDRGQRMTAANPKAQYEATAEPNAIAIDLKLDLAPPSRRAQRIVELKGALTASTAGRIETFRLEPVEEAVGETLRQGPLEVTLRHFRRNGSLWEALLTLRYDKDLPAFDSHRSWVFSNEIYLERSDGTRIDAIPGDNVGFPAPGMVEVSYQFSRVPRGLDAYALVYRAPSMVVPVLVEFEFHDLPLP